jgi:hypothetical protein
MKDPAAKKPKQDGWNNHVNSSNVESEPRIYNNRCWRLQVSACTVASVGPSRELRGLSQVLAAGASIIWMGTYRVPS